MKFVPADDATAMFEDTKRIAMPNHFTGLILRLCFLFRSAAALGARILLMSVAAVVATAVPALALSTACEEVNSQWGNGRTAANGGTRQQYTTHSSFFVGERLTWSVSGSSVAGSDQDVTYWVYATQSGPLSEFEDAGASQDTGAVNASSSYTFARAGNSLELEARYRPGNDPSPSANVTITMTVTCQGPASTAAEITTQPESETVAVNGNVTFRAAASNSTGIRWQVSTDNGASFSNIANDSFYSGATMATLTITAVTANMDGNQYRVVASGAGTPATSNAATLTVQSPPANTRQPQSTVIATGTNAIFTAAASNTTSYQWQVTVGNSGSFTDIQNGGVYSGTNTPTLTIAQAAADMNGNLYRLVASGVGTPATSNSARLTVANPPVITLQPQDRQINTGQSTTVTVAADFASTFRWQIWRSASSSFENFANGSGVTGTTTSTLNVDNARAVLNGARFRVVVTGASGLTTISEAITLTVVNAPAITTQPQSTAIATGANATFRAAASNATGYQWQVSAGNSGNFANIANDSFYSGATTATLTITAVTADMDGNQYRVVASGLGTAATSDAATLTVSVSQTITEQPRNQTAGVGGTATFAVTASNATAYQWQAFTGSSFIDIQDGGVYSGAKTDRLTITGAETGLDGQTYRVLVKGAVPQDAISDTVSLTVQGPPEISGHPADTQVLVGNAVTFQVTASGATGYQWQMSANGSEYSNINNNNMYSGATTSTLTITGATAGINGYRYRAVASGAGQSATSNAGSLTILVPPTITSQPQNVLTSIGGTAKF